MCLNIKRLESSDPPVAVDGKNCAVGLSVTALERSFNEGQLKSTISQPINQIRNDVS